MGPGYPATPEYISETMRGMYAGMIAGDPDAIWVLQGWFMIGDPYAQPNVTKAIVTAAPIGRMIVLDLSADAAPIYPRSKSLYGQPFIWNLLLNFGGVLGFYGDFDSVNNVRKFSLIFTFRANWFEVRGKGGIEGRSSSTQNLSK